MLAVDPYGKLPVLTLSLSNVDVTAPYMHDGSIPKLHEVLRSQKALAERAVHAGLRANPQRSEFIAGSEFCDEEVADAVALTESLTDKSIWATGNKGKRTSSRSMAPSRCPQAERALLVMVGSEW